MEINIPLIADEKGYIDRKCVNDKCCFVFKVAEKDLYDMSEIHCPLCGYHNNNVRNWMTEEQYNQAMEIAKSYAQAYVSNQINRMFSDLARKTRSNKYCKITYKPGKPISYNNNPIFQREKWQLDIKCEKCSTEYSVIGTAYFCPKCGHNNILKNINNSLDTIKNMIKSQNEIYITLEKSVGIDNARTMCQKLIEDSLKNVVSAFQTFSYELFKELKPEVKVRPNDFQMVEVGNELFKKHFNKKYEDYITNNEIDIMNTFFNRRHLLEHTDGIVDQKYLDKTNDNSYVIGQRIIIKENDVLIILDIVRKLCAGLQK